MKQIAGLDVAERWDDLSFSDYCNMYSGITEDMTLEEKMVHCVCNLLSIDANILFNMKKMDVDNIFLSLLFIKDNIEETDKGIEIDGKTYIIPIVEEMTYRQYIDIESSYDKNSPYDIMEMACCLFVEAGVPYSPKGADELKKKIGALPCKDVVGNVLYFVKKKESLLHDIHISQELEQKENNTPKQ